ncbi:coiled-coil domain-containing protein 106-like [Danio aesculapii]|uniref:coiled-coil domain-containing protein 106-like n=1 Tax=Danio aesculapii TaxID=1142201 RepID=UPI0024BFBD64|nr:coiled-coil domain-containing protein 106-like [Danio aesculapii]
MENSDKNRKGVRTRAKRNDNVEMDTIDKTCGSDTSGVSMAPTAHLPDKRQSHELEMCKLRVEMQKEKIDELTKERDCLKEQLASALKKDKGSSQAISLPSNSSNDSSVKSSSDALSDTSSTSSSEVNKKQKKVKRKVKEKKNVKKSKKMEMKSRQRAQTPQQVVARYKKILRHFSRGGTMSSAFKHVGVDRNTIVANAPIAELYIAAPNKFKELVQNHISRDKLSAFATQCAAEIHENQSIEETVSALKSSNKLLPIQRK